MTTAVIDPDQASLLQPFGLYFRQRPVVLPVQKMGQTTSEPEVTNPDSNDPDKIDSDWIPDEDEEDEDDAPPSESIMSHIMEGHE